MMNTRDLISPEELDALFSTSHSSELATKDCRDDIQLHDDDISIDIQSEVVESENHLDVAKEENGNFTKQINIPECVISLYEPLSLGTILLQCHEVLAKHFEMEFFTLVQPRKNKTMVTIYSASDEKEPSYGSPEVVELSPTRLSDCMLVKQRILKYVTGDSDLDRLEKKYLLPVHAPKSDVTILYWPVIFDGMLKGVLVIGITGRIQLSDAQDKFLSQLCRHLPVAIKNSDAHYNERRRNRQLEILSEIACEAVNENDFKSFISKVSKAIRKSFNYNSVQVWIGSGSRLDIAGHNSKYEISQNFREAASSIVHQCWEKNRIFSKNYSGLEIKSGDEGIGKSCFAVKAINWMLFQSRI
ncbi:MAG: hypothetical protein P8Z37_18750 [Acidobacteriota bacterium]